VVTFDAAVAGTAAAVWSAWGRLSSLPELTMDSITRLVVVAAHPDDETLGAGGLIAEAGARGVPVLVIVVTDGAASHPNSPITDGDLAGLRSEELRRAVAALNPAAHLLELGFPDGRTRENRDGISAALAEAIPTRATIAAPWRGDGHRDHRVVGELCAAIAEDRGETLLEYPIWMWHWSDPVETEAPWPEARRLSLSPVSVTAKQRSLAQYRSQIAELDGCAPVLRADFLEHFLAPKEIYFVSATTSGDPEEPPAPQGTKTQEYFDRLYAGNGDPWRLSTRWYEARKRAITVASLPRSHYETALEIGCSVGELTALLAERAGSLLALDISAAAVEAATRRTAEFANTRIERRDATTDFPASDFDLIVLSEVGYYWDIHTLREMIDRARAHLATDGMILACHWRHPVADYPLRGDTVHETLRATSGLERIVTHEEEDFILEIFAVSGDSVARREGLLG